MPFSTDPQPRQPRASAENKTHTPASRLLRLLRFIQTLSKTSTRMITPAILMLVMGSNTGNVKDYPNWEQNLSLAVKVQNTINILYPGLSRSILFKSAKYNQNLSTGAMLIEVGTEANTLDEALYSGELIGKAVAVFLGLN